MKLLLAALLLPMPAPAPTEIFSDVTAQAGITWEQFNGESPERYLVETTSGASPSLISTMTACLIFSSSTAERPPTVRARSRSGTRSTETSVTDALRT